MHTGYRNPTIKELCDQQVRYAPREKKIEQLVRAERLLSEIDPAKTYSYEYLCFRITNFRPDSSPNWTMSGAEAHHDLRLLIEDVSDAADLRADEAGEPVHTVEDLSRRFNVSSKTISRWRQQGLVSRRFIFGGRKRIGFLDSSVKHFVSNHEDRVRRGDQFSQMSREERTEIVDRVRRLAQTDACPTEIMQRVARHANRSPETIRYTIQQYDEQNPDTAIFPDRTGPLTAESRQYIYQQFRRGTSVNELANHFRRTATTIYRIVNEMRAERIDELPLDYIPNPCFEEPNISEKILGPMPIPVEPARKVRVPSGLPSYLASLYEVPLLTREQEEYLFRKLNYLKFRAARLREGLKTGRALRQTMDEIEKLYEDAVATKNQIVQANLRLVVSIAKRHVNAPEDFFELVSDGNMSLIRAVEKFDYARGNKFSTYATWALMKNYARSIPDEFKHRDRYRTSFEEMFVSAEDLRGDQYAQESIQRVREEQIQRIMQRLDEREQRIIISRFGLRHENEPQTLKEVGEEIGVTKERVRQLEARALDKLRQAAAEEHIDDPE